jgi:phosphoribosylformylglycinamidine synthase I
VLGICNGFQILVESELLPGALMMNDSLRFVCRWINVQVTNNKTRFTSQYVPNQIFAIPVAHGDGRYVADSNILKEMEKKNQIVLRYTGDNPNGSASFIAAICNEEGNVMGMMPHPERASEDILRLDRDENSKKMGNIRKDSEAITIFKSLVSNLDQKAIA